MSKFKIGLPFFILSLILNIQTFAQSNKIKKSFPEHRKVVFRSDLHNPVYSDSSFTNSFFLLGETDNKEVPFVRMDSLLTFYNSSFGLKNLFKYNQNEKISESVMLTYFGPDWENLFKDIFTYNIKNKIVS